MINKLSFLFLAIFFIASTAFAQTQTAQTKKQSLPQQPGFVLQDGTVYTVDQSMELNGNDEGDFINGLAVAENATVTLYIPAGVELTVIGQNANIKDAGGNVIESQHGAGAGIYVPASSTLYITGEGTLVAKGGDGGNGGNGTDGQQGKAIDGKNSTGGIGGDGGAGGGGGAAAIGGNGGNGGGITTGAPANSASRRSEGANGVPMLPTSTEYNGKDGSNGMDMGNVYILGSVIVETTKGIEGSNGGAAGYHGEHFTQTKGQNTSSVGGGGAGAGGGAGMAASFGIGGGGAGAGGGAAGGSGAVDSYNSKNVTFSETNMYGHGGSAIGYGEGAVNGSINNDLTQTGKSAPRDEGAASSSRFPRFGGYGGSVGGKAGAQGGNGTVYIEHDSEANLGAATIGNLVTLQADEVVEALSALKVNIKMNFLNDGDPNSGVLIGEFGEYYTQLPSGLIPTRPGYDFVGYFTQAVGGTQMFDKDGKPATTGARCLYVQDENPTLYAHWILSTYTITWKYDYYSVDVHDMVEIPEADRSYKANVIIRLTDGNTYNMVMTNPQKSQTEYTHKVTLRNELTDEIFNKVVAVEKVEPVAVEGADISALMTLDYVSESSAKIFYDPTRYMVKWNVSVNATTKPEYIILSVKRGTSDDTADGNIPTDGEYAENATIFDNLRIRKNANGTYSGSAVLMYEQDASTPFHYSVSVVGVRDDSGHEYMFPTAVSSKGQTDGIMYCSKPSSTNPTPQKNIENILLTVDLKQLTFDPNSGTLDDGSPEKIWAPTGTSVTLKDGGNYPYTATRMNYHFEGWNTANDATVGLDNITLNSDQTVYAVFMDRTPPTITFGDYSRSGAADNYHVSVIISDAISTQNVVYYAVYDTNPGDIPANDLRWGDQKGKTQKKAEAVNIDFSTTSVVYVHVKAVDESENAAVASKEIKVDNEAPVIRTSPNVDGFCKTTKNGVVVDPPVVDITDNAGVTGLTITVSPNVTLNNITDDKSAVVGKTATLAWPQTGSVAYTFTAKDAAGNQTVRTITVYAEHDWDNGSDIVAKEPMETEHGAYRYRQCAHCSHIVLLRGEINNEIDMTDESQINAWQIPKGAVMVMEPWNGTLDIVDNGTYVNDALTKANSNANATQVRLSRDTQVANNTSTLTNPSRRIDIELNGHGLLQSNGQAGTITGAANAVILLTDNGEQAYTNKSTVNTTPIKYVRNVSKTQSGKWQALYIPFVPSSASKTTSYGTALEIKEDNGEYFVNFTNGGTPSANGFCLIKSGAEGDEAGVNEITATGATLSPASVAGPTEVGCDYTIAGSMTNSDQVATVARPFWVVSNGGKFGRATSGTQRPYRWVIYGPENSSAKALTFRMVELPTGVDNVRTNATSDAVYTLDGRRMQSAENLKAGVYIIGGKKMVVR